MKLIQSIATSMILASCMLLTACDGCGGANTNNATDMSKKTDMDMSKTDADMSATNNCTAGMENCACEPGDTCQNGLMCSAGKCISPTMSGLKVTNETARSCEILLEEKDAKILGAEYADGIKGAWRKRAPHVSLVLSQSTNSAFPTGAAKLKLEGETSGVSVEKVRCFDHLGKEIAEVTVTLD